MPDPDPLPSLQTPWGVFSPGSMPAAGTSPTPQVAIPDHTLIRQIGQGAYGEVWLARNALGQYRAVKILHRRSFADDRPFEREFAGMQRFEPISRSHESQHNILHVGRGPGHCCCVMEVADDQERGPEIDESRYIPRTLRSDLLAQGRLQAASRSEGKGRPRKQAAISRQHPRAELRCVHGCQARHGRWVQRAWRSEGSGRLRVFRPVLLRTGIQPFPAAGRQPAMAGWNTTGQPHTKGQVYANPNDVGCDSLRDGPDAGDRMPCPGQGHRRRQGLGSRLPGPGIP